MRVLVDQHVPKKVARRIAGRRAEPRRITHRRPRAEQVVPGEVRQARHQTFVELKRIDRPFGRLLVEKQGEPEDDYVQRRVQIEVHQAPVLARILERRQREAFEVELRAAPDRLQVGCRLTEVDEQIEQVPIVAHDRVLPAPVAQLLRARGLEVDGLDLTRRRAAVLRDEVDERRFYAQVTQKEALGLGRNEEAYEPDTQHVERLLRRDLT